MLRLSVGAGLALLLVATFNVMRVGARMGSGPSTTKLGGVVLFVGGVAVLTAARVPVASHVSVRVAMGLVVLPIAKDVVVLPSV